MLFRNLKTPSLVSLYGPQWWVVGPLVIETSSCIAASLHRSMDGRVLLYLLQYLSISRGYRQHYFYNVGSLSQGMEASVVTHSSESSYAKL